MTMESNQLRNIIEGALLAAGEPLSLARLNNLFEEEATPTKEELLTALEDIADHCEGRGFELKEVASGWRFQVRVETAPWVNRLWEEKPQKYSRAVLETLALVAYRQPITRGDIEEIRGVAVSSHIIRSLTEREWVKVVGHRDVPGRPSLYATTRQFLDYFNLKSLDELPSLGEIRDLDEINNLLDLDGSDGQRQREEDRSDELAEGQQEGPQEDQQRADAADSAAAHTAEQETDPAPVNPEEVSAEEQGRQSEESQDSDGGEDTGAREDTQGREDTEHREEPEGREEPEDSEDKAGREDNEGSELTSGQAPDAGEASPAQPHEHATLEDTAETESPPSDPADDKEHRGA